MTNTKHNNPMYFEDVIPLNPSPEQIQQNQIQFDTHNAVYNAVLDHIAKNQLQSCTIDSLHEFILQTFKPNDPIYGYVTQYGDEYVIRSTIREVLDDMNTYHPYYPPYKQYNSQYQYYPMYFDKEVCIGRNLMLSPIRILLPVMGETDVTTTLSPIDQIAVLDDNERSRIFRIDIRCDKATNETLAVFYKIEYAIIPDSILEVPNTIGVYLDEDIYSIALSNGKIIKEQGYIRSLILEFQNQYTNLKQVTKNVSQKEHKALSIFKEITRQRHEWFISIADQLISQYKIIYIENQARTTPKYNIIVDDDNSSFKFRVSSWLQFLSILRNKVNKYESHKLYTLIKNRNIISTCNRCGAFYPYGFPTSLNNPDTYVCRVCKTSHNLRTNAAKNILKNGLAEEYKIRTFSSTTNNDRNSILQDILI